MSAKRGQDVPAEQVVIFHNCRALTSACARFHPENSSLLK